MLHLHDRCGFAKRVPIIRRATSEPIFAVKREQRMKAGASFFDAPDIRQERGGTNA
jgi:hypothetical protein